MIKKIFVLLFLTLLFVPKSWAKHSYPEKYYQNQWCGKWNGAKEYTIKDVKATIRNTARVNKSMIN